MQRRCCYLCGYGLLRNDHGNSQSGERSMRFGKEIEKITIIDAMSAFGNSHGYGKTACGLSDQLVQQVQAGRSGFQLYPFPRRTLLEQCEKATPTLTAWTSLRPVENHGRKRKVEIYHPHGSRFSAAHGLNWKKRAALKPAISVIKKNQRILREGMERLGYHTPASGGASSLRSLRLPLSERRL